MITHAIEIALKAHEGEKRKGTDIPYSVHPIEVGVTLAKNKLSDEIIVAGIIHDAVEQEFLTLDEVENVFNGNVRRIMEKVYITDKRNKNDSYLEGRKKIIKYLREQASPEFKFVTCADRLSNIKMMEDEEKKVGKKLWERFDEKYEERKWYYQSLIVALDQISSYKMYSEFVEKVKNVFGEIPPSIFMVDDLQTIEEKMDIDVAERSLWLTQHMISFLGGIVERLHIDKDENIPQDVKNTVNKAVCLYKNQNGKEELNVSKEDWLDFIKLFYILRPLLKFYKKWIEEHMGVDYLGWYKLYDMEFQINIK